MRKSFGQGAKKRADLQPFTVSEVTRLYCCCQHICQSKGLGSGGASLGTLQGQWIGVYPGDEAALGIIDIDERRTRYQGAATIFYGRNKPIFVVEFSTENRTEAVHKVSSPIQTFWPNRPTPLSREELSLVAPGQTFSERAEIEFELADSGHLRVRWSLDGGPSHQQVVEPSQAEKNSTLKPIEGVTTWADFKRLINDLEYERHLFRGQAKSTWRLRSKFHRSGRSDVGRYLREDVTKAHSALQPHLDRQFTLAQDSEHAAFLFLLQHYGYPTPLLDWSKSPWVAAYFAFSERRAVKDESAGPVRIHQFSPHVWMQHHDRFAGLTQVGPAVIVLEPMAINNVRAPAQQGMSTATNIDDLETFIAGREEAIGEPILQAIDLDYGERDRALRDLRTMGITAERLFPGLAGAVEKVAIDHFDLDGN